MNSVPKRYAEDLTPVLADMTLFGDRAFANDEVKMRPLECVLIQYDWCPYKKVKFGHRDTEGECQVKVKDWTYAWTSQGTSKIAKKKLPEARKRQGRFPLQVSEGS